MTKQRIKISIGILFLMVFLTKMTINIAPAFFHDNYKTAETITDKPDQDNKTDKDTDSKDQSKEKKFTDDVFDLTSDYAYVTPQASDRPLNAELSLFFINHYPSISTPPPDQSLVSSC